jgi:hypothetical protein
MESLRKTYRVRHTKPEGVLIKDIGLFLRRIDASWKARLSLKAILFRQTD